jgi:hypothetical protein
MMEAFELLIGEWDGEGEIPIEPPMKISEEAEIERLGELIGAPFHFCFLGCASAGQPSVVGPLNGSAQ